MTAEEKPRAKVLVAYYSDGTVQADKVNIYIFAQLLTYIQSVNCVKIQQNNKWINWIKTFGRESLLNVSFLHHWHLLKCLLRIQYFKLFERNYLTVSWKVSFKTNVYQMIKLDFIVCEISIKVRDWIKARIFSTFYFFTFAEKVIFCCSDLYIIVVSSQILSFIHKQIILNGRWFIYFLWTTFSPTTLRYSSVEI